MKNENLIKKNEEIPIPLIKNEESYESFTKIEENEKEKNIKSNKNDDEILTPFLKKEKSTKSLLISDEDIKIKKKIKCEDSENDKEKEKILFEKMKVSTLQNEHEFTEILVGVNPKTDAD